MSDECPALLNRKGPRLHNYKARARLTWTLGVLWGLSNFRTVQLSFPHACIISVCMLTLAQAALEVPVCKTGNPFLLGWTARLACGSRLHCSFKPVVLPPWARS